MARPSTEESRHHTSETTRGSESTGRRGFSLCFPGAGTTQVTARMGHTLRGHAGPGTTRSAVQTPGFNLPWPSQTLKCHQERTSRGRKLDTQAQGTPTVYSLSGPPRGQGAGVLGKRGKKEHAPGQSRETMRGAKKARFGGKLRREMERVSTHLFFQGNGFVKAPSTLPK